MHAVVCPLVSSHFEALRGQRESISAGKAEAGVGSNMLSDAKASLENWMMGWVSGGSTRPTDFQLDCLSGAAAAAAQLGPTGAAWRPLFALMLGSAQQSKDAAQLFASLSNADAIKW